MKIVTPDEMAVMDKQTIDSGIADYELMERAGTRCYEIIASELTETQKILVLCGTGNNGGDGQVIARLLHNCGYSVSVLFVGKAEHFSPNALQNYKRLTDIGAACDFYTRFDAKIQASLDHANVIVDAVFGNGLKDRPLCEAVVALFDAINARSDKRVYAIDMPSGLRGDTGQTVGAAIRADKTLIIQNYKTGHLLGDGSDLSGEQILVDVGILERYCDSTKFLLDARSVPELLPRKKNSHKYDYGALSVIAGSQGMLGAGLMAATAALRAGAGLVTSWVPKEVYSIAAGQMPWEIMVRPYDADSLLSRLRERRTDAYVVGPGLGRQKFHSGLIKMLIAQQKPMVIDADGLYHLLKIMDVLKMGEHAPLILTPHVGEFAKLCGTTSDAVRRDPVGLGTQFVKTCQVVLVLKGHHTSIFEPDAASAGGVRIWFNTTGNPGMATAGSGDVLAGIIGGLIPQMPTPADAAKLGVYLHGLAGDLAADEKTMVAMTATDVLAQLPAAIRQLQQEVQEK
ncbi:NAD(P)H-hydrate dehydratase [Pseudoramibacter faecis]|uniref:NAD(P)H-hydrate dehydratase n=1 Tax=Pseudoramibacter faecis TaxID=3108534 RepID=UPI002E799D10|nr:NAD(P)H-hydrate dehydratase [Pseudoramibacter sp. HA2172]